MEREPDFDEQDSGVPVTPPDRNPDPEEPARSTEGGPAVPDRSGGIAESDPAQGL